MNNLGKITLLTETPVISSLKKSTGWVPDEKDIRDFPLSKLISSLPINTPSSAKLRDLSPVRDQGSIGSCVGFAIAYAVEFLRKKPIEDHWETLYSPLFTYYFARVAIGLEDLDSGSHIRDGIKSVNKIGISRESDWKYYRPKVKFSKEPNPKAIKSAKSWRLGAYYRANNLNEVKKALAGGFPVVGGFLCYANLGKSWSDGIVPLPWGPVQGGHAVMFTGYNDVTKLVSFQNSWGESWGDNGHGYLPYEFFYRGDVADLWVLEDEHEATKQSNLLNWK